MLLSIADGRPRNVESVTAESLFPESLQTVSAKIISFIEEYYRYLNTVGLPSKEISSIISVHDIDSASNQYLDSISELIAKNVPQSASLDKVSLYKLIVKYYTTRGSEESAISFFKLFLDDIVTIFYPRDRLFDLSSGKIVWQQYEFPPIKLTEPPTNGGLDVIRVGTTNVLTFENSPDKNIIAFDDTIITYGDPLTYNGTAFVFVDLKYAGIVNGRYAYTDTSSAVIYEYSLIYDAAEEEWQLRRTTTSSPSIQAVWTSTDTNAENIKLPPIDFGDVWSPGVNTTGVPSFTYFSGDFYGDVTIPDRTVYPDGKTNDYAQIGEFPGRTVYRCTNRGGDERDPENRITWIEKPLDGEYYYADRKGFVSDQNIIQDSDYWQSFSYEIISSTPRSEWKDAYTKFVHPAGLKLFNTLLMQFFASNVWNDYLNNEYQYQIDYWKGITKETPYDWLDNLWPPWYKEIDVARQQHSPHYQPGINFGGIPLEFIIMYSQSDADRAALIRLVILTYEYTASNSKSERFLVNYDYDSQGIKFIDQCPLREGLLNRVIGDMTNRTGELFIYKNENLPSLVEIRTGLDSYWARDASSVGWSTDSNWEDGVKPIAGSNIFFNSSTTSQNLNNNISGLTLNSITFNYQSSQFTILGNSFTLPNASYIINRSSKLQTIANPIVLGNGLDGVALNAESGDILLSGVISGSGKLIKSGESGLTLSGTNTYSGITSIIAGTISVTKSIATAVFTPTELTVTFSSLPSNGTTYKFFPGSTTQTYSTVTLIGAPGRTATYNSTNSTLTIATSIDGLWTFDVTAQSTITNFNATTSSGTVTVEWSDGTSPNTITSGQNISHTYIP